MSDCNSVFCVDAITYIRPTEETQPISKLESPTMLTWNTDATADVTHY